MALTHLREHLRQLQTESVFPFKHQPSTDLKPFVALLPDMLQQMHLWCDGTPGETNLKRLYSHLLAYVFHGDDLLPELDYGFWGYLDDAYLVGLAVAKTWGECPLEGKPLPDFLPKLQLWLQSTQQLLPDVTRTMQHVFGQMMLGNYAQFDQVLMQDKLASASTR
jgi:uncharacterized membrane protein YkvA (DUF1232 family)